MSVNRVPWKRYLYELTLSLNISVVLVWTKSATTPYWRIYDWAKRRVAEPLFLISLAQLRKGVPHPSFFEGRESNIPI